MNKTGILWKLRLPEQEISIAEESGPVRTFKCYPILFEKLRQDEVREGCFIQANFCMEKRMIVDVERVILEGYVTKWAPKYAFVHSPIIPQVKLTASNRVSELKFIHNPPSGLSSTYLNPAECEFPLENNMAIRFSLICNLKKTTGLRNEPYCDLKAIKVQKMNDRASRRGLSASSSEAVDCSEARLGSWLSRRMSSPRVSRSPGSRTPEPSGRMLDEGFRRRGGSAPLKKKKHFKRDPAQNGKRPVQSAPVTPAKDIMEPDCMRHSLSRLPKSRPQSASILENPPISLFAPSKMCLRCQEEKRSECNHKPPKRESTSKVNVAEARSSASPIKQEHNSELEDKCARLQQVVDDLRLQLQQKASKSNVQPSYKSRQYNTPSLHVSYDQAIKNRQYDTIFAHSPSASPSSSPVPEIFQDPEKFLPFLSSGGKPSSTRSDVMNDMISRERGFDTIGYDNFGTPITQCLQFNEPDEFFCESRSSTQSTPSWASHEPLSAREHRDYYERRKSPREMADVRYVPPLKLPSQARKIDGERTAQPLVNQDLNQNKADTSRWAVVSENDFTFQTPSKSRTRPRYELPNLKNKVHPRYDYHDFQGLNDSRQQYGRHWGV